MDFDGGSDASADINVDRTEKYREILKDGGVTGLGI